MVSFHDYGPPEPKQLARWAASTAGPLHGVHLAGPRFAVRPRAAGVCREGNRLVHVGASQGTHTNVLSMGIEARTLRNPIPGITTSCNRTAPRYRLDEIGFIRKFPGQFHFSPRHGACRAGIGLPGLEDARHVERLGGVSGRPSDRRAGDPMQLRAESISSGSIATWPARSRPKGARRPTSDG